VLEGRAMYYVFDCRKTYVGEETGVTFEIQVRSRSPWSTIGPYYWGAWDVLPGQLLIDGGEYNWDDDWSLENYVNFYPPGGPKDEFDRGLVMSLGPIDYPPKLGATGEGSIYLGGSISDGFFKWVVRVG